MAKNQQGYNDRLDESLSAKHGKESDKKQSLASRRHESEAMSERIYRHKFGGDHSMAYETHGEQANVHDHINKTIKRNEKTRSMVNQNISRNS